MGVDQIMRIEEIIKSRRTIHSFKPGNVTEDILAEAFEMGGWAPNHKLTLPLQFFKLGKVSRSELAELALEMAQSKQSESLTSEQCKKISEKILECPEIVIIGQKKFLDKNQELEDYATVSCAVQNISLFLWSRGIGCKWSTGAITKHERLFNIIKRTSETTHLRGFLWIGVPKEVPPAIKRPDVNSFLIKLE